MTPEQVAKWLLLGGNGWVDFQHLVADGILDGVKYDTFLDWLEAGYITRNTRQDQYGLTHKAISLLQEA
jgi:hypothetical protein